MPSRLFDYVIFALLFPAMCVSSTAADWPMYRCDAARSGFTPDHISHTLQLRWTVSTGKPRPAWPSAARVTYDFAHHAVAADGHVVFGNTIDDSVTAVGLADGLVRWKFFTGSPVRFAPAVWQDRVFVGSDDGFLYALSLADGRLLWKHRGGPNGRLCLGNERMISRWPARGGPVIVGDIVYYAAGIWPSNGVYLHALDAATGTVRWTNGESGGILMSQPHGGAEARSGVTPQGYLATAGDLLFVPTGRAVPAAFRRDDGGLLHYLLQENGSIGGSRAIATEQYLINGGCFLDQATGKLSARAGRGVFSFRPDGVLQFTGDG